MKDAAQHIRELIDELLPSLARIPAEKAATKPDPGEWSKKELIGHLIDSAANNHQRFVRAAQNLAADFPPYAQEAWVTVQGYQTMPWEELVALWYAYNRHLCRVIANLPQEALDNPCHVGLEEPVTLAFVVEDYVRHLRHHMGDLVER